MRVLVLLTLLLLQPLYSSAQEQCPGGSTWWREYERFIPRESRPPLTVRINLVVPQKSDGSRNFQEDDSVHLEVWRLMMEEINHIYRRLKDPKDEVCYPGDDFVSNTGIQFKINEIIYVKNDSMWNSANGSGCPREKNWFLNEIDRELRKDPMTDRAINVYMPNGPADEYGLLEDGSKDTTPHKPPCSEMPTYRDLDRSSRINLAGLYNKYQYMRYIVPFDTIANPELEPWDPVIMGWHWYTICHTLAHELGHSLGLAHHNEYHGRNKCETALMNQRHGKPHSYIQPSEIGKMQRTLRMSNIREYVEEDIYSPHPLVIADTAHIDIAHKSYEDIRIPAGGELKVSCGLSMPSSGRIIVEPGGTLILDRARLSGRGQDGEWEGVILRKERRFFLMKKAKGRIVYSGDKETMMAGAIVRIEKMPKKGR